MTKILVDTSVLIEAQKKPKNFAELVAFQDRLVLSRMTASELIYGARSKEEKSRNQSMASFLPILEVNETISKLSYSLIDQYNLKCHLTIVDSLIAATAVHYELPLWTLNKKHFKLIKKLELFEPV